MFKAIAAIGTVVILTSFVSAAHAQPTVQAEPMGSASSLDGLQERSVTRPSSNAPVVSSQRSTDVPGG